MTTQERDLVERLRKLEADLTALAVGRIIKGKFAAEMRATVTIAKSEITRLRSELEKLSDPINVHVNMLRGTIAIPSVDQYLHAASLHERWQLVPKEPTREMLSAGALARHSEACDGGYSTVGRCAAEVCWPAMLASSPPAPEQKD